MPEFLNTSFGLKLTVPQVVGEILRFMRDEPTFHYRITIGTDSDLIADGGADFVTAVVIHRVGNGGKYFWRRAELGKFHTLRDRIIQEVMLSLDLAKLLLQELNAEGMRAAFGDAALPPAWDFEIHVDIGENGPTQAMLQEVVGMIRAHNFVGVTKPGSYAASNVADRHV